MAEAFEGSDPGEALKHIRLNRGAFRALRRVVLEPRRSTVVHINGDGLTIEGVGGRQRGSHGC